MRIRIITGFAALAVVGLAIPAHASHLVQVDMSEEFNADVIVNGTSGAIDDTQRPADKGGMAWITQSAAEVLENCVSDPNGLPDNAVFPADANHPRVKLGWNNSSNKYNTLRFIAPRRVAFPITPGSYKKLHVFAASGEGSSTLQIKLKYVDLPTENFEIELEDWFADPVEGTYSLIDGRDRGSADGSVCQNDNGARMVGIPIVVDKAEKLRVVKVAGLDDDGSVLTVYGMMLVKPGDH